MACAMSTVVIQRVTILTQGSTLYDKVCKKRACHTFECKYGLETVETKEIEIVLEALNLNQFKENHPATLSGGQKQRLAVAVSLLSKKDIIIFDEPTSGLDLENMIKVSTLIKTSAGMGKVVFVVTHDYEFIAKNCTRIIRIENRTIRYDLPINGENIKKISKEYL